MRSKLGERKTTNAGGEKGILLLCWWEGNKVVQPVQKSVWRRLKGLKLEIPHDPGIPVIGISPKEFKTS